MFTKKYFLDLLNNLILEENFMTQVIMFMPLGLGNIAKDILVVV